MTRLVAALKENQEDIFRFFEEVYLFGSSLRACKPNDVDIILVYKKENLACVKFEKGRVAKLLASKIGEVSLDFITLNKSELIQTEFLTRVDYEIIKG